MTDRIRQTMYHPVFTTQTGSFSRDGGQNFRKEENLLPYFPFGTAVTQAYEQFL